MKITIALPQATYTAEQYELFMTEPGCDLAAHRINGWIDAEIAARAFEISSCGDKKKVANIASEINAAVRRPICAAKYDSKYGACDSEPAWLITKHISKVCRGIAGITEEDLNAWHIY